MNSDDLLPELIVFHLDKTRRDDAVEAGWRAYREWLTPAAEVAYRRACGSWDVIAVVAPDGEAIGALFSRDGEVHVGIQPSHRGLWASRRLIREMLAFGTHTEVRDDEDSAIEFVKRLGFKKEGGGYVLHRSNF